MDEKIERVGKLADKILVANRPPEHLSALWDLAEAVNFLRTEVKRHEMHATLPVGVDYSSPRTCSDSRRCTPTTSPGRRPRVGDCAWHVRGAPVPAALRGDRRPQRVAQHRHQPQPRGLGGDHEHGGVPR